MDAIIYDNNIKGEGDNGAVLEQTCYILSKLSQY